MRNCTAGPGAREPTPEDAALVARALRDGPLSTTEWREIAASLGVRVVRRDLAGVGAVLAPGVLFLGR